jgi:hypothetical protein
MAIARKPKSQESFPTSSVNVDALIAKGGSVAQESTTPDTTTEETNAITAFTLRVPKDILKIVDGQRKKGAYKVPRQQWILEAIMQRLEKEVAPAAHKDS